MLVGLAWSLAHLVLLCCCTDFGCICVIAAGRGGGIAVRHTCVAVDYSGWCGGIPHGTRIARSSPTRTRRPRSGASADRRSTYGIYVPTPICWDVISCYKGCWLVVPPQGRMYVSVRYPCCMSYVGVREADSEGSSFIIHASWRSARCSRWCAYVCL